ncbi:MAG: hypothetical protein FWG64_07775 [Firmicutes bacterium]|nr:hypothetical protein [Bacillota bacterium]
MLKMYVKIFTIFFAIILVACGNDVEIAENAENAENTALYETVENVESVPVAHPLQQTRQVAEISNFSQEVITLGTDEEVFETPKVWEIIPSRDIYYIIIRGIPFQLHPNHERNFDVPVRAELAFVGTELELRDWQMANLSNSRNMMFPDILPLSPAIFFAVNLYNANDLLVETFVRSTGNNDIFANLNIEEDTVEFVGTWGQIVDENLVNFDLSNAETAAFLPTLTWDEWQAVAVRTRNNNFQTIIPIQNSRDWRFVPPTSVQLAYENEKIILRLYDENENLMSTVINEDYTFTSQPRLSIVAIGTITQLTNMNF